MIFSPQTGSAIAAFSGLAVLNLSIMAWLVARPPFVAAYLFPCVQIAEAVLLACWLVHLKESMGNRLAVIGFLSVPLYFVPLLRAWTLDDRLIGTKECLISPLIAFGLSLLVFRLGQALFRYRFVSANDPTIHCEHQMRFTIRSFFTFTFLTGLLMVTMKLAWHDQYDGYGPYPYPFAKFYGVLMQHELFPPCCLTLACIPIPYLLMNERSFAATKTLLYAMFLLLVIFPFGFDFYEEVVYGHVLGWLPYMYSVSSRANAFRIVFSGGALIAVMVVGLSLLRSRGIRLTRQTEPSASSSPILPALPVRIARQKILSVIPSASG